jgi:membrane-associated protease RseP (regulator of RpoE activity)
MYQPYKKIRSNMQVRNFEPGFAQQARRAKKKKENKRELVCLLPFGSLLRFLKQLNFWTILLPPFLNIRLLFD